MSRLFAAAFALFLAATVAACTTAPEIADPATIVRHRTAEVNGVKIFYREAGTPGKPALLLLHGFPTSSHMFRDLMPLLADRYHLVAPDLPGFGFSDAPERDKFKYSFENLTAVIDGFTQSLGLKTYSVYAFDYGAPIAFRLALAHPERITAIVSQAGNAYEEGLSPIWGGIKRYWSQPNEGNRNALRPITRPGAPKGFYAGGVKDQSLVAPEFHALDGALLARPGNDEIQLDLLLDYKSNVDLYPKFQEYFRSKQPPLLAVWGKNDPIFVPAGAEAFKRDLPKAEVKFYDTGHFALTTHAREIAADIRAFLGRI